MNVSNIIGPAIPFFLGVVLSGCKRADDRPAPPDLPAKKVIAVQPDSPIPFGYKCAWLAIRSEDPAAVVAALRLEGVRESNWQKGVEAAYDGEAFVTPPLKGWVLVASAFSFPDVSDAKRVDHLSPFLLALCARFPDVQYFVTHRVAEYHGWARATDGKIIRQYFYSGDKGETICDRGEITPEEKKLGLLFNNAKTPTEQDVTNLAGAWSIDSTALDQMKLGQSVGYLGSLPAK